MSRTPQKLEYAKPHPRQGFLRRRRQLLLATIIGAPIVLVIIVLGLTVNDPLVDYKFRELGYLLGSIWFALLLLCAGAFLDKDPPHL